MRAAVAPYVCAQSCELDGMTDDRNSNSRVRDKNAQKFLEIAFHVFSTYTRPLLKASTTQVEPTRSLWQSLVLLVLVS